MHLPPVWQEELLSVLASSVPLILRSCTMAWIFTAHHNYVKLFQWAASTIIFIIYYLHSAVVWWQPNSFAAPSLLVLYLQCITTGSLSVYWTGEKTQINLKTHLSTYSFQICQLWKPGRLLVILSRLLFQPLVKNRLLCQCREWDRHRERGRERYGGREGYGGRER